MNKKVLLLNWLYIFAAWLFVLFVFCSWMKESEVWVGKKTDAIVVLTGGSNRIKEGVDLLNKGMGEKLFISGVNQDVSIEDIISSENLVITTDREIVLDKKSKNTSQNAAQAMKWADENGFESIRLVTSWYHLPRSLAEFYDNNDSNDRDVTIVGHPVLSDNVERRWWNSPKSFWLVMKEYHKFMYVSIASRF